ncbi:type IV leader peptidase family protein, partial [Vibrio harveyi]
SVD